MYLYLQAPTSIAHSNSKWPSKPLSSPQIHVGQNQNLLATNYQPCTYSSVHPSVVK